MENTNKTTSKSNYLHLKAWFEDNFQKGDFIKLKTWGIYKIKVIDIGDEFIIIEHEDKSLGWRYIDCDWVKATETIKKVTPEEYV
jgi:hypothetical protein